MKSNKRFVLLCFFSFVALLGSYYFNFTKSQEKLHTHVDAFFHEKAPRWGEYIFYSFLPPYKGQYDSELYRKKKKTTIMSATDTIEISTAFYHPISFAEFILKNRETTLLLSKSVSYDVQVADSLFKDLLNKADIIAETSVELKIRDLHQMFPRVDSMCQDAPFVKTIASGSVEGYTTQPVGVGICDHGMLYGHVKVAPSEVLARMSWFGMPQLLTLIFLAVLWIVGVYYGKYVSLMLYFNKHVVLVGNTCIDIPHQKVYLWNGECRTFSGIKQQFLKLLLEAAPSYKLSKEHVCRTIWNRNAKDGQALYNVALTDMRNLFILDDPALELLSFPKEGAQLLIDHALIKKDRRSHFAWIYLCDHLKKKQQEKE